MRSWPILIFVLSFWGCQDVKQPEKPKNLIGKDKMINVLTEAYLANAARSIDNKAMIAEGIQIDSLIYSKFDIDSLQFVKSNAYYAADVNTYIALFQEVEVKLNAMIQDLDSIRKEGNQSQDSIIEESVQEKKGKSPLTKRLPNLMFSRFH